MNNLAGYQCSLPASGLNERTKSDLLAYFGGPYCVTPIPCCESGGPDGILPTLPHFLYLNRWVLSKGKTTAILWSWITFAKNIGFGGCTLFFSLDYVVTNLTFFQHFSRAKLGFPYSLQREYVLLKLSFQWLLWMKMISTGICELISGPWHAWLALFRLVVEIVECILTLFLRVWIDLRNVHWDWILLRCRCTRFVTRSDDAIGWRSYKALGFKFVLGFKWTEVRRLFICLTLFKHFVPEISAARGRESLVRGCKSEEEADRVIDLF